MTALLVLSACSGQDTSGASEQADAAADAVTPDDAAGGASDALADTQAGADTSGGAGDDVTESEDSGEQDGSGAAEDADAELPDMGSPDTAPDVEVDPDRPATPTVCTDANRGTCACNDAPGFTTWTWWVADQQRCATTYVPPAVSGPLPVVISNDCYSSNGLGVCQSGSEMVEAAGRFGFIGVCTTAADGNWTFGNDGVVNDDVPTPCAAADSKDVLYLDGVFGLIDALAESGEARADAVYAWGFSQNAMFTAWTAFCRPERIAGFWQGGSGLFVAGETNPLPQMEGACRRSDFLEHDRDCVDVAPCEDCQYFPVYPAASTPPLSGCVSAYTDDFLFETVPPMAREMAREGHAPTELHFPDIGRGHANPLLHWEWMMGCMQVVEACDDACAASVVACVDRRSGASAAAREADFLACAGEAEGAEVCRRVRTHAGDASGGGASLPRRRRLRQRRDLGDMPRGLRRRRRR